MFEAQAESDQTDDHENSKMKNAEIAPLVPVIQHGTDRKIAQLNPKYCNINSNYATINTGVYVIKHIIYTIRMTGQDRQDRRCMFHFSPDKVLLAKFAASGVFLVEYA